jgi:hypothetical protein
MGILDDAIREHLELKRSHGAPEEELRRQEVEALGIAHDEAIREDEDVDAARAAGGEQDPALEDVPAPEQAQAAPLEFDPDAVAAEEPEFEPVFEPEAEVEPLEVAPGPAEPEIEELPEPDEPPLPADLPPAAFEPEPREEAEPPPRRHSDTPTQGFDALAEDDDDPFADEPSAAPPEDTGAAPDDADLLEDTPDFLEETPEHDRLWFEQRPPRDFDFD